MDIFVLLSIIEKKKERKKKEFYPTLQNVTKVLVNSDVELSIIYIPNFNILQFFSKYERFGSFCNYNIEKIEI